MIDHTNVELVLDLLAVDLTTGCATIVVSAIVGTACLNYLGGDRPRLLTRLRAGLAAGIRVSC